VRRYRGGAPVILAFILLGFAALGALIGWQACSLWNEVFHEDEFGRPR
jgi:hypothetical protein